MVYNLLKVKPDKKIFSFKKPVFKIYLNILAPYDIRKKKAQGFIFCEHSEITEKIKSLTENVSKGKNWLKSLFKKAGAIMSKEKSKYSDSNMKPDKTCHYKGQDKGTVSKDSKVPGQMYCPKKDHNESNFAGEKR